MRRTKEVVLQIPPKWFQACGVNPRGDRRDSQPRHQLPSAGIYFCQLFTLLVLTISETYDHILQCGVRQMSEDPQANGTSNTGRKAEK